MTTILIDRSDHFKLVLTNERGDTFTSKSEDLDDFLHDVDKFDLIRKDVYVPLEFVKLYSGMEELDILKAYERYKREHE
jgi:hypothetical protein